MLRAGRESDRSEPARVPTPFDAIAQRERIGNGTRLDNLDAASLHRAQD